MSVLPLKPRFSVLKAIVFAAALALAGAAQAEEGPFGGMGGSWEGTGSIALGKGATNERIRCRAQYQIGASGSAVTLDLRCASDSYKFELHGNIRYQNGEVRGDWSEKTRGTAGSVAGSIKGDQLTVRVDGPTFAALLSLTTKGDKQSISIKAPDGSEMAGANITLNRRS